MCFFIKVLLCFLAPLRWHECVWEGGSAHVHAYTCKGSQVTLTEVELLRWRCWDGVPCCFFQNNHCMITNLLHRRGGRFQDLIDIITQHLQDNPNAFVWLGEWKLCMSHLFRIQDSQSISVYSCCVYAEASEGSSYKAPFLKYCPDCRESALRYLWQHAQLAEVSICSFTSPFLQTLSQSISKSTLRSQSCSRMTSLDCLTWLARWVF